ncbi:MAG: 50S ribosomal protein L3 [Proteobacteria bacterium]|nr:50S ribosomal protein L3 [Pseudomonadota bacterium]
MTNVKGIVAKKIGMTRMIDGKGQMIAVTLLQIEKQKITKVLSKSRDGYDAYQIGYFEKKEKGLCKPDIGRLRKNGIEDNFSRFVEVRLDNEAASLEVGRILDTEVLKGVMSVDVTGITKGRGFTGSVKRWDTACGRMSHGSRFHRRPGSLGTRTTPGRVFHGKPVPGHYGVEQVTIQNLGVVDLDSDHSLVALKGAVPGHRNGYLLLNPSIKSK